MRIRGKLIEIENSRNGRIAPPIAEKTEAEIELPPEKLAQQIKDEEELRYITANFYLYLLNKKNLTRTEQEPKPEKIEVPLKFNYVDMKFDAPEIDVIKTKINQLIDCVAKLAERL